MLAVGVKYADFLNLAAQTFGVEQAIMQSIIEVIDDPLNITGLKDDDAIKYAQRYAQSKGRANVENNNGMYDPEANIMAGAWKLVQLRDLYGDAWNAVHAYFEVSPVGLGKMRRIYFNNYPKYKKAWGALA